VTGNLPAASHHICPLNLHGNWSRRDDWRKGTWLAPTVYGWIIAGGQSRALKSRLDSKMRDKQRGDMKNIRVCQKHALMCIATNVLFYEAITKIEEQRLLIDALEEKIPEPDFKLGDTKRKWPIMQGWAWWEIGKARETSRAADACRMAFSEQCTCLSGLRVLCLKPRPRRHSHVASSQTSTKKTRRAKEERMGSRLTWPGRQTLQSMYRRLKLWGITTSSMDTWYGQDEPHG